MDVSDLQFAVGRPLISAAGPPACEERDYAESKTHALPAVARFRALSTAALGAGIGLAAAVAQAADGRVPVPTPLPAKIEAIRLRIQGLPKEERRAANVEILGEPTSRSASGVITEERKKLSLSPAPRGIVCGESVSFRCLRKEGSPCVAR